MVWIEGMISELKLKDLLKISQEYFVQGNRACAGCGETIAIRIITKILGPRTIVVNPTGCVEIVSTPYPETAWRIPYIHHAFENAAAVASGIEAGLRVLGRKLGSSSKINVAVIAGDGATHDIGLQSLSGAMERYHNLKYFCLDNEAYMNTGIQRSSSTPLGAWTTTSPPGKLSIGELRPKKDIIRIAASHDIPYAATASIAYPVDLANKTLKATQIDGPCLIHVHTPCPPGWRFDSHLTVEIARRAVRSGIFPLYEIEHGKLKLRQMPKRIPVEEYLKLQGRFSHLFQPQNRKVIEQIQRSVEDNLMLLQELAKLERINLG